MAVIKSFDFENLEAFSFQDQAHPLRRQTFDPDKDPWERSFPKFAHWAFSKKKKKKLEKLQSKANTLIP